MADTKKVVTMLPALSLKNDRKLWIATGRSRFDTKWRNRQMTWSALLARLQRTTRTQETYAEYLAATKAEQGKIKDIGGFVGGTLKDGHRGAQTVTGRSILSYDLDFAPYDFYSSMTDAYASACYSTHKHSTAKPRYRLLVPLDRTVNAEEYEAVARMLATHIGLDWMDPTTFQPSRLMYWPSCSQDGQYFFDSTDAPFLSADKVLAEYPDWTDATQWPASDKETSRRKREAEKQQSPEEKKGIVGAFCRTYDIHAAIAAFLADVYTTTVHADRYTYAEGSTSGGLVVYEGGAFAYSNHGTDPASGQLCNAFDLVRLHRFGALDVDTPPDTQTNRRPSYKAMAEFAASDKDVRLTLANERHKEASSDFTDDAADDWEAGLVRSSKGVLETSVLNCMRIFEHDPALQGLALDELSEAVTVEPEHPMPWQRHDGAWTDTDDAQLYSYIATQYAEFPRQCVLDQKAITAARHGYHPVKRYLEALPEWDGVKRADKLFVDYLGAADSPYTREATFKMLLAAVRRIYEPGCKYDTMMVLAGPQGIGKSLLISKLAGSWFSDNLTFEDMRDKTAAEKLAGYWILEIGELKGMRKMDQESVKAFVSRQEDIYRAAYGRNIERHKRRCVIFGTTNDLTGYLRDATGNRRFWPVSVTGQGVRKPWDMSADEVSQIWAEILFRYQILGERNLLLSPAAQDIAGREQIEAMEQDDREGMVEAYLSTALPDMWDAMDLDARLQYLDGELTELDKDGAPTHQRDSVSNIEIWCECFRSPAKAIQLKDSYAISSILARLGWARTGGAAASKLYGKQRIYKKTRNNS